MIKANLWDIHTWKNGDRMQLTPNGWVRLEHPDKIQHKLENLPYDHKTTITDEKNRTYHIQKTRDKGNFYNVYNQNGELLKRDTPVKHEMVLHIGEPKKYHIKEDGWGVNPSEISGLKVVGRYFKGFSKPFGELHSGYVKGVGESVFTKDVYELKDFKNKKNYNELINSGFTDNDEVVITSDTVKNFDSGKTLLTPLSNLKIKRQYSKWGLDKKRINELPNYKTDLKLAIVRDVNGVEDVMAIAPFSIGKLKYKVKNVEDISSFYALSQKQKQQFVDSYYGAIKDGIEENDDVVIAYNLNNKMGGFYYVKLSDIKEPTNEQRKEAEEQKNYINRIYFGRGE